MRLQPWFCFLLLCAPTIILGDEISDAKLAKELVSVVRDSKAGARSKITAAQMLGKMEVRAAAVVPDLVSELARFKGIDEESVQEAIIDAIGRIGGAATTALPALAKHSGRSIDLDVAIKNASRTILGSPESLGISTLLGQLSDRDASLRLRAVKAIGALGPINGRIALNDLEAMLKDGDDDVRRATIDAIRNIDPVSIPSGAFVTAIAVDLSNPDEGIRFRSARQLGRLGKNAILALPALEKALDDPDKEVRRAVLDAMQKINPQ